MGCGLVAQVMHLPYLGELADHFELTAFCDLSPEALRFAGAMFPAARRHERVEHLLAERLDVVLVLTPGSHAPVAVAAAEAGCHVFVEKPMSLSAAEGSEMLAVADRAGVRLMVGYMKRYDPAYEELARSLDRASVRFARVTTLESPHEPYVSHYPLERGSIEPGLATQLAAEDEERVTAAIGTHDAVLRRAYRSVLLDSMIHELNAVRGLLGEPDELRFADVWGDSTGVTATLRFGAAECVFSWVDLPGIARYEQELAFYGPDARASLRFPSPFLRSVPTLLTVEGGDLGAQTSWRTERTISYDEAFKRELLELHACIREDREPRTPGADALRDVALCQAIVASVADGRPRLQPADPEGL